MRTFKNILAATAFLIMFLYISFSANAQIPGVNHIRKNFRSKMIPVSQDTIKLDSLSIIFGSVFISFPGKNESNFSPVFIDYANASIQLGGNFSFLRSNGIDSVAVRFRVFNVDFGKEVFHKDIHKQSRDEEGMLNPFVFSYDERKVEGLKIEGITKSGSISRGISVGNNQDVVVNSSLNLQLAGKVSDDIDILAAITDENIPVQPDGNTQQLQEFDKVFIQLSNPVHKLIAGDFELTKPNSHFMNFFKKGQGGSYSSKFPLNDTAVSKVNVMVKTGLSAAISKGKFGRNIFDGVEGNQGPYKLRGNNNEIFIVVLSGSEKVFINGQLMVRGQENDYVIDYNAAQIIFTPNKMITKDSRIIVEFQYSDKNYVRSMLYVNNEYEFEKAKIRFNFFSEQDGKNQPLQQDLSDEQKILLSLIGDDIESAIVPNIDSTGFRPDEILYRKIDTLDILSGIVYQSVYVYSTNPDSAFFRLGFSNVGQGNGNYVQVPSAANGRVYQWIAPLNGIKQGSFEPVVRLVTPRKQQLATLGGEVKITKNTLLSAEGAMSNNDLNTFSTLDAKDNRGYALKTALSNTRDLSSDTSSWKLKTFGEYELADKLFIPVERYRSVEFERDWNTGTFNEKNDEHFFSTGAGIVHPKRGAVSTAFNYFLRKNEYNAWRQVISGNMQWNTLFLRQSGSYLKSETAITYADFARNKADVYNKFRWFTLGLKNETERNSVLRIINEVRTDSMALNSFANSETEIYTYQRDTAVNQYRLGYSQRRDWGILNNQYEPASVADNVNGSYQLLKFKASKLDLSGTYRNLSVKDSVLSKTKSGSNLVSRAEYSLTILNGGINSTTFYEFSTGQEQKKEFVYVLVPTGQGNYTWIDNNGNGVKELDEFFEALTPDKAEYVKVSIPTNEFVRSLGNQFSEVFYFNPAAFINKEENKFLKTVRRFSTQTLLRTGRKIASDNIADGLFPYASGISDSLLVSMNNSVNNTLFFNRTNPKFGVDAGRNVNVSKSILTNGFESRNLMENTGNIRIGIRKKYIVNLGGKTGEKSVSSEFFTSSNYRIRFLETEPRLSFQPNTTFRISVFYKYSEKENILKNGGEKAVHNKVGTDVKLSSIKQGTILARVSWVNIQFGGAENSSLSYEMLDGMKAGNNLSWGLSAQRNLSQSMQLSLSYDARKPGKAKSIHTGSVQVRAFF